MKVLSIRQPWAWLITHAGKDIENREWVPQNPALHVARELVRSRDHFLIHTSLGMTRREYDEAAEFARGISRAITAPAFDDLPRGGIVGLTRLADIVGFSRSPWFLGPIGLALKEAAPLPFRLLKGQRGFFDAPRDFMPMRRDGVWRWADA